MEYNASPSSSFAALQERFELEAKKGYENKVLTKDEITKSNHVRNPMFKEHAKSIRADRIYIENYKDELIKNYVIALQMQLNVDGRGQRNGIRTRFQNVGYASGRLYKSIRAGATVSLVHDRTKGRYVIDYKIEEDITDAKDFVGKSYGGYLNYFRPARKFSAEGILTWMKHKMKNKGGLKIYNRSGDKESEGGLKQKAKLLTRIAFAIRGALMKEPRAAVVENWSIYDKNVKLRNDFKKLMRARGGYLRTQIKKSVMRNIMK